MGNNFSAASEVDILGKNDTQELTPEETKIVEDQNGIFSCFFRHPTMENYQALRANDDIYHKALSTKYKAFLMAVRETFKDLQDPISEEESLDYNLEVDRLLDLRNALCARDLDILWTLYYATGDLQFTNRIKAVMNNDLQHELVRGSAKWSYDSHVKQGMLEDPEWDTGPGPAGLAEVIQFAMNQQKSSDTPLPELYPVCNAKLENGDTCLKKATSKDMRRCAEHENTVINNIRKVQMCTAKLEDGPGAGGKCWREATCKGMTRCAEHADIVDDCTRIVPMCTAKLEDGDICWAVATSKDMSRCADHTDIVTEQSQYCTCVTEQSQYSTCVTEQSQYCTERHGYSRRAHFDETIKEFLATQSDTSNISHLRENLLSLFDEVNSDYKRLSQVNHQFVLFKLLQKLKYPCREEDFFNKVFICHCKMLACEKIWEKICNELSWDYVATV